MWDNESELNFLKIYQSEPILWESTHPYHKDKKKLHDAWIRISEQTDVSIEELKKKKLSLMATFRGHMRDINVSLKSGAGSEEVHKPTWFAFDLMNSFLGHLYKCKETVNTVNQATASTSTPITTSITTLSNKKRKLSSSSTQDLHVKTSPTPYLESFDDDCLTLTKGYATKMRKLTPQQLMFVDKVINDALLDAQMGGLSRNSYVSHLQTSTQQPSLTFNSQFVYSAYDYESSEMTNSACKIFNTVYSLVKRNRPLSDIEDEFELQTKNGINLRIGLHPQYSSTQIVEHIAKEIKRNVFSKIIERNLKICIIIDEIPNVFSKSILTIFLKIESNEFCPILFVDLIELEDEDEESIYSVLLTTLSSFGMNKDYLQKNLIGFCSDGTSTLLGCKTGIRKRIIKDFSNIIIWNCLSHRLQLTLNDSLRDINHGNHFKIFVDKIYLLFHESIKNQQELSFISDELGTEILKIGRVLDSEWAASSLQLTSAIWQSYPTLYRYFSENEKYSGIVNCLNNKCFLKDLALMMDILEEISLLSNALQSKTQNLAKAHQLILRTLVAFEQLKENPGYYESQVDDLVKSSSYKDIDFQENSAYKNIPRKKLIGKIIKNMTLRLINPQEIIFKNQNNLNHEKIHNLFNTFEPTTWKLDEIVNQWKAGEEYVRILSEILKFKINLNDFRDYVDNVLKNHHTELPETIKKAKNIINSVAVSSAEIREGLFVMNTICSEKETNFNIGHISNLMTINLIGLPLTSWDPTSYVQSWFKNHHSDHNKPTSTATIKLPNKNQNAIWNEYM